MCTDGAPVNVKTNGLIRAKLGDHYMLPLCPTQKLSWRLEMPLNSRNYTTVVTMIILTFITYLKKQIYGGGYSKSKPNFKVLITFDTNDQVIQDGWSISVPFAIPP